MVDHARGYGRIVEVSRVDVLVGGVLDHALGTGSGTEGLTGHGGELERAGEHIGGDTAQGIEIVGRGSLIGHIDPFALGFNQQDTGVGERRVIGYRAAGLDLQRSAAADRVGQNLAVPDPVNRFIIEDVDVAAAGIDGCSRVYAGERIGAVLAHRQLPAARSVTVREDRVAADVREALHRSRAGVEREQEWGRGRGGEHEIDGIGRNREVGE